MWNNNSLVLLFWRNSSMKLFDIFFQNIKQQISFFIKPGSHRPWDKKNQEMLRLINPLYPKSVQYWISPCYTSVLYNRVKSCKLRTWSHKMRLIDTWITSFHYSELSHGDHFSWVTTSCKRPLSPAPRMVAYEKVDCTSIGNAQGQQIF